MNLQKFYMGESFAAYEYFGAHLEDGSVVFRTNAPNAREITVVGEFTGWKEEPMQQLYQSGVWVGCSRDAKPGQMYKYVVYARLADWSVVIPTGSAWNCAPVPAPSSVIWPNTNSPTKSGRRNGPCLMISR